MVHIENLALPQSIQISDVKNAPALMQIWYLQAALGCIELSSVPMFVTAGTLGAQKAKSAILSMYGTACLGMITIHVYWMQNKARDLEGATDEAARSHRAETSFLVHTTIHGQWHFFVVHCSS